MERNDLDLIHLHAINCAGGFGPQGFRKLEAAFPALGDAWRATRADLEKAGITAKQIENLLGFREKKDPRELFAELEKEDIDIIIQKQSAYPPQLKEIPSAPAIIYVRGNKDILKNKSLAIVGSRKFTEYGKRATESLARDLVRAGLTIVSGLALGIDGIAHAAALENEGATVAVLGTGIDDATIYPREHFNLAKNIIAGGGTLLTEYPPRTPSLKQNFPARNRIMAGLTLGTLVVEAATDSGSLITAGLALEFSREVFAVPGPIFSPQSAGSNFLIKNGAKLVESASDVLAELNLATREQRAERKIFEPQTAEEKKIWGVLSSDPFHVDRIAKMTKLNPAAVNATLAVMEIQEAVRNVGGQNYIKM